MRKDKRTAQFLLDEIADLCDQKPVNALAEIEERLSSLAICTGLEYRTGMTFAAEVATRVGA